MAVANATGRPTHRLVYDADIPAFAYVDNHRVEYVALGDGIIVAFQFHVHGAERATLTAFSRRTISLLRGTAGTSFSPR